MIVQSGQKTETSIPLQGPLSFFDGNQHPRSDLASDLYDFDASFLGSAKGRAYYKPFFIPRFIPFFPSMCQKTVRIIRGVGRHCRQKSSYSTHARCTRRVAVLPFCREVVV